MPARLRRLAASLCCLAAACDLTEPLPSGGPPRTLEVRESGFGVDFFGVELRGDTLVVRRSGYAADWATTRARVPDAGEWRVFWAAVRETGVRGWPSACDNPRVADGGGFGVELAWDGGRVRGEYVNSYPRSNGRCSGDPSPSAEGARFLEAVRRLAGEPPRGP